MNTILEALCTSFMTNMDWLITDMQTHQAR